MAESHSRVDRSASSDSERTSAGWKTSVLIHVALLGLAVVVVWSTIGRDPQMAASASAVDAAASPIAPETVLAETEPFVAASALPRAAQAVVREEPVAGASVSASTATQISFSSVAQSTAAPAEKMTTPDEAPAVMAIPEPGQAWPVRMSVAPQDDPYVAYGRVYGTPGATRIVYLIDASGSLIDTLPFVQAELQKALRSLRPGQSYAVMFLVGDRVVEAPPVGMKLASTRAVTHTMQWVDPSAGKVIASGRPNAHAAIRRALAYQPDAVVLLSDGLTSRGPAGLKQRAQLVSLIETANTAGTVFHTVQLREPDPLATSTRRGTLEMIARRTGGVYRFVGEDELDTQASR
ncbi:MAG: hypothetical protein AAF333_06140 [Planctomycetota bacterium]